MNKSKRNTLNLKSERIRVLSKDSLAIAGGMLPTSNEDTCKNCPVDPLA